MRENNEVKVDLDYRKKGIKGVERVGFQNRCVYDVGMATIVDMQDISSGVDFHALDIFRG